MKTYKFTINGNKYTVDVNNIEEGKAEVEVNRTPYTVEFDMPDMVIPQPRPKTVVKVAAPVAPKAAPATASVPKAQAAPTVGGSVIKSPLPGIILELYVHVGDTVKSGQRVILLEAMKMENNIDADRDGVIKDIRVRKGDSVMEGDPLLIIE